ncbi:ABC transporter permease [Paenarthrobacter sp. Z7-10]|uniref:ABC transporter permease n=1 Tax=Paenarthrobacter sp. Z7-10 TaxID=2787635 RepID=UPI0022A92AB5|nr:ABC transporter permease [Paenarthrobacter sp. Z7-10]MCZ2403282.1 ABC transporter permease [Paenarthrobacter sp. Z7-10]
MRAATTAQGYTSDNPLIQGSEWLIDPENWEGANGIPARVVEHLGYSGLTLLIAVVIAVPIGLYVGHTGRGRVVVIALAGVLRALPTLGVLTLFVLLAGLGLMPPIWALVLLAIPPILAGTFAGISSVSRDTVDAARSMGMTEPQILFRVEVPNGLSVIFGGCRAAVLQVVATVAVVAYINLGGLGRYLIDGLSVSDYGRVFGGAIVIAALAIVIDSVLAGLQRLALSPGLKEPRRLPGNSLTGRDTITAGVQGENS